MSRFKPLVERNKTDRIVLRGLIQNPLTDPVLALRAQAILLFFSGLKGDAIAKELNVRPNTISDWRKKYEENGVEGLYDKERKGNAGSSTREQVLEKLKDTPPEGGWTTKALAEAVGTSQDTVRRALREKHLTVSKAFIWDNEVKRFPDMVYVNAIGLFLSKEEAGLIIKIDATSDCQPAKQSYVTTSNRNLAKSLSLIEQTSEGLSLYDAINASIQMMKEVPRGQKESFQSFTSGLLRDDPAQSGKIIKGSNTLYYILYWYDAQKESLPVLQKTGVAVEKTDDIAHWLKLIEPWIGIMTYSLSENQTDNPDYLIERINMFIERTTNLVEPFEWRRASL